MPCLRAQTDPNCLESLISYLGLPYSQWGRDRASTQGKKKNALSIYIQPVCTVSLCRKALHNHHYFMSTGKEQHATEREPWTKLGWAVIFKEICLEIMNKYQNTALTSGGFWRMRRLEDHLHGWVVTDSWGKMTEFHYTSPFGVTTQIE